MIHNHEVRGSIPRLATTESLAQSAGLFCFEASELAQRGVKTEMPKVIRQKADDKAFRCKAPPKGITAACRRNSPSRYKGNQAVMKLIIIAASLLEYINEYKIDI